MKTTSHGNARIYLDDGTYLVSANLLSTPRRFYPIANVTARIRRDPLWLALGMAVFATLTTLVYGDLLFPGELLVLWGIAGAGLLVGLGTAILHVDAVGHRGALIVASSWRVRAIYRALRQARMEVGRHDQELVRSAEGEHNE